MSESLVAEVRSEGCLGAEGGASASGSREKGEGHLGAEGGVGADLFLHCPPRRLGLHHTIRHLNTP